MPKRKRDDLAEKTTTDTRQPSLKQLRAEQKLHHGRDLLARAFRTARGFERQKLGRRRKAASSSTGDARDGVRIDAEVVALKVCCDPAHAARMSLD